MLLEVDHVTKVYGRRVRANDEICLEVEAGDVFGLLGHNGAGKTTLLQQVVGLTQPDSGVIRIDGIDAVADPRTARRLCSFQPQTQAPLDRLTPRQGIELMARIRGANRRRARERAAQLLAALEIEAWADTISEQVSGGVRRLTAFCMAAAEPGKLVMFDEPTNDVDPVRRRLLWEQIRALADGGCGVVLVTHNVVEAERAVEQLVILDQGKVVARGTPAALRGDLRDQLRLEITALHEAAATELEADFDTRFTALEPAVRNGRRSVISISVGDSGRVIDWARQARDEGRMEEFAIAPVSLEDVYIRLVGPEGGAREADDATVAA